MYGTIARLRAKPEMGAQLEALTAEYESLPIPGMVATHLYRLDSDSDGYYLVVIFEDRDSYHRNANDPAQNVRYERMRALLAEDPTWHDGEIVWSFSRA
jgi:quinol monooxygenase YgiN